MPYSPNRYHTPLPRWLQVLLTLAIVLGLGLRFTGLETKTYWIDEVHTSLRVVGYAKRDLGNLVPGDRPITIPDLHTFQRLTPGVGWGDTWRALVRNAEHPPLFYGGLRLWMGWWGSSIAVTRSWAAVLSLLLGPVLYGLCQTLFQDRRVTWMAIALVAVSPLHVLYAQEAREYSLATVTLTLASWAWLRTHQAPPSPRSGGIYGLTVAIALYSHLINSLVILGHGVHGLWQGQRQLGPYFRGIVLGLGCFLPWIALYFFHGNTVGEWTARPLPLPLLVQRWLLNLCGVVIDPQIFFPGVQLYDIETGQDSPLIWTTPAPYLAIALLVLAGGALFHLARTTPPPTHRFILALFLVPGLALVLPDLLTGGQRSTIARYAFPPYLALQLAIAHALVHLLQARRRDLRRLGSLLVVLVLGAGLVSDGVMVQAPTWWNKYSSFSNPAVAALINAQPQPLVITSQARVSRLISLGYELRPEIPLLVVSEGAPLTLNHPETYTDYFLFRPDASLYRAIAQDPTYHLTPLHAHCQLWHLDPREPPKKLSP